MPRSSPQGRKENTMEERTGAVTFQGNPLTLVGAGVTVGDDAPDFTAVDGGLNPVSLSSFAGK